jgi:hypothetical protein
MLYPLSYEGARPQVTCQRIPTSDRASQPVPTSPASENADRRITRRPHHAGRSARVPTATNPYQPGPVGTNDSPSFHASLVDLDGRVK